MTEMKHIGIFYKVRVNIPTDDPVALKRVEKAAAEVQHFIRTWCPEWDTVVKGFVMPASCDTNPPRYCKNEVYKRLEDEDFEPNYYHLWGGVNELGYGGQGDLGGNWAVTFSRGGLRIMLHELFHNFGLMHASSRYEGGESEYGDGTSVMGKNIRGLNAPNLIQLGLETAREIRIVTKTTQVLTCPLEYSEWDLHPTEDQTIIIKVDGSLDHYIGLRKGVGHSYALGANKRELLYIYERTTKSRSTLLIPSLKPGESKTLPNGVTIDYREYQNETARVDIEYPNVSFPDSVDFPTGFPPWPANITEEHSGLWVNPKFDKQGFYIRVVGDRGVFYWYCFNEREDSRRFFFGPFDKTGEFDLFTTSGGKFSDPGLASVEKVGTGKLAFTGGTTGVFLYEMDAYGGGSVEIESLMLSDHPMNGAWVEDPNGKDGFCIQFKDDLCIAIWFTAGPPIFSWNGETPYSDQRWFLCTGKRSDIAGDATYTMKIIQASGLWNNIADATERQVGSADLFIEGEDIVFDYEIDAEAQIRASGTFNLKKLF